MPDDVSKRKTFTTTIRMDVVTDFKVACVRNGYKMNDVLEVLMERYVSNDTISQYVANTLSGKNDDK